MDDGDKKNQIKNIRKKTEDGDLQRHDFVSSSILQSLWVRCRSIFPDVTNGKFMESELRYVFYCGILFWIAYILSQAIR